MNRYGRLLRDMVALVELFSAHCTDSSTLVEIKLTASNDARWKSGHDLFLRIRDKALAAQRSGDQTAQVQYSFEEACAKTLYNLSATSTPFDADSPYWILPRALALAQQVGLDTNAVIACIDG